MSAGSHRRFGTMPPTFLIRIDRRRVRGVSAKERKPPGPPMDLTNMREQGVRNLIALNDACRHQAVIDVSSYPGDTPVLWFRSKVKCAKCGAGNNDRRAAELERGAGHD